MFTCSGVDLFQIFPIGLGFKEGWGGELDYGRVILMFGIVYVANPTVSFGIPRTVCNDITSPINCNT